MASLLTNVNVGRVESNATPTKHASYLLEQNKVNYFWYLPPSSRTQRPFYTTENARSGRWSPDDTIAYLVSFMDGRPKKTYIPLNGLRVHLFNIKKEKKLNTANNAAEIYRAVYQLISAYLELYATNVALIMGTDQGYVDLHNLIVLEMRYLSELHNSTSKVRVVGTQTEKDRAKLAFFGSKTIKLRTLWNSRDTIISVDAIKFDDIVHSRTVFSLKEYENIFNYTHASVKTIIIRGVNKMTESGEYQRVMENIGVRQMIFQGPPGTSKTFDSMRFVLEQLNETAPALDQGFVAYEEIARELADFKLTESDYSAPDASAKKTTGGWDIVQLHPSYGYEDFIRGIEVQVKKGSPAYESVNRIFGKIAEFARFAAKNKTAATAPKFYLIIDEINRANLAIVFGELIYGLEYRNSAVSTPYEVKDILSGNPTKDIVLGKNLFIVGTMNTADKSIASLDYAIRRRFIFIDSPANRDIIKRCYQHFSGKADDDCIELLLFDAVQRLFDEDKYFNNEYQKSDVKIGHTYFLRDRNTDSKEAAIQHFIYQVIPILREYVKDGILDSIDNLRVSEHTAQEIKAVSDGDKHLEFLCGNIMLYIKEFGNKNKDGKIINNAYISDFIERLCAEYGYC